MKIKKTTLKQIIKEELGRVLDEDEGGAPIYGFDPEGFDQIPELTNKIIDARASKYAKTPAGERVLEIAKEMLFQLADHN